MKVRLIAGKFGGRLIDSPNKATTHPMSERIRNAIFNMIGDKIIGAEVLDAFAGTGALGLESLSRGAEQVTFIDKDSIAHKILTKNIIDLQVSNISKAIKAPISTWIEKNQGNFYDIIFADPPFNDPQLSTVAKLLGMLKPNGLMLLSYLGSGEVPAVNGFVVVDNRRYGNAALAIYRRG